MKGSLSQIINIGKVLEKKLNQVGINSYEELLETGAENTFIKILTIDPNACINMLYALEGAIQGVRKHNLSSSRKRELLDFYKTFVKKI